jgi:uncharacterized membrane protein
MQIPVQWSIEGVPLAYQPKYIIPFINIGIYYLLLIKTIITTDNFHFDLTLNSYFRLRYVLLLILSIINVAFLMFGAGYDLNSSNVILLFLFFLIVLVSEFIQNISPFSSLGIITPWTLKSKAIWIITHRYTSKVCFWLGVFGIVFNIIDIKNAAPFINALIIGSILIFPIAISFYLYRHFQGEHIFQN